MKIILFLQVIYIWVATPENRTNISSFDNELVQQATVMLLEEYLQEELIFTLTKDSLQADITVQPYFERYTRPTVDLSLSVIQMKEEEVGLGMRILFYDNRHKYFQPMEGFSTLVRKAGSSLLDIQETEEDLGTTVIFTLIKKTVAVCFEEFDLLVF